MSKADEKQKGVRAPGPALKSTGKARSGGPVVPELPPEPVEIPKDAYVVSLPSFEGPLDLLLQIIQKHELDILDIPISFITEKYLAYLTVMQSLSIDVASEYLVMAATLAHIKSKMLLPELPSGQDDDVAEEELDPREELVRRLLEYQKYKAAAEDLGGRDALGRDVFVRGTTEDVPDGPAPFAKLGVFELLDAFSKLMGRSKVKIEHEVVFDRISISDRINELCDVLRDKRSLPFEALFPDEPTRFDLIITFLALLEMCRLKMLNVFQVESLSPIHLQLLVVDDDDEPLALRSQPPPKRESEDDTSHGAEAADDASLPTDDVARGATDDAPEPDDELLEASETELTSDLSDVVDGTLESEIEAAETAEAEAEVEAVDAETAGAEVDAELHVENGVADPRADVEAPSALEDEAAGFDTDPPSRVAIDASDTEVSSVVEPMIEGLEFATEPVDDADPDGEDGDDVFAGSSEVLDEAPLSALPPVEPTEDSATDDSTEALEASSLEDGALEVISPLEAEDAGIDAPNEEDETARKLRERDGDDAAGPDGSMSMNETVDPASHDERAE